MYIKVMKKQKAKCIDKLIKLNICVFVYLCICVFVLGTAIFPSKTGTGGGAIEIVTNNGNLTIGKKNLLLSIYN